MVLLPSIFRGLVLDKQIALRSRSKHFWTFIRSVENTQPWFDFRRFRRNARNQMAQQLLWCFSKCPAHDFELAFHNHFISDDFDKCRICLLCHFGWSNFYVKELKYMPILMYNLHKAKITWKLLPLYCSWYRWIAREKPIQSHVLNVFWNTILTKQFNF